MWFLIPLAGAALGAYIGRESPVFVWTMFAIMIIIIAVGLGDPAVAVIILGAIVLVMLACIILYHIVPIIIFLIGAGIALAFVLVVFAGIFKLLGV